MLLRYSKPARRLLLTSSRHTPDIRIIPKFGLCNRMRALDSAFTLARNLRLSVEVVWQLTWELGCCFEELFLPPRGEVSIVNVRQDECGDACAKARFVHIDEATVQKACEAEWKQMTRGPIEFASSQAFFGTSLFSDFVLTPQLKAVVDQYGLPHRNAVGVHIRRTDHIEAIENSPREWFEQQIVQRQKTSADTEFFLATDDLDEQRYLERKLSVKWISHPKHSVRRGDLPGMQDAVVDLFCLSQCKSIIGSYGSSFSATAAAMGNVPLVTPAAGAAEGSI